MLASARGGGEVRGGVLDVPSCGGSKPHDLGSRGWTRGLQGQETRGPGEVVGRAAWGGLHPPWLCPPCWVRGLASEAPCPPSLGADSGQVGVAGPP